MRSNHFRSWFPRSAKVVEVEYFRNPASAILIAFWKSSRDKSATCPRTSAVEGSTLVSNRKRSWWSTIYGKGFAILGINPFATDETFLDEQGTVFQLNRISACFAVLYLCILNEFAVSIGISVLLNHFLCCLVTDCSRKWSLSGLVFPVNNP